MARESTYQGNEVAQVIDADDRQQQQQHPVSPGKISKTIATTTTTTVSTKTIKSSILNDVNNNVKLNSSNDETLGVAAIEDLGRQADMNSPTSIRRNLSSLSNYNSKSKKQQSSNTYSSGRNFSDSTYLIEHAPVKLRDDNVGGNKRVTTIATVAAQSGQSRIVLALLKDADSLQLKIQEMRPGIFEVGGNFQECLKYFEEHEKLMKNLRKQKQTPIECWLKKYEDICKFKEPNMSTERKLVYMCMAENLQGCWKALLNQLDQRTRLLETACRFYESCERLIEALDQSDNHVQVFRQEFLSGPNSSKFNQACSELKRLNEQVLNRYNLARINQQKLVDLVSVIGTGNLGDARVNYLITDAKALITYINTYLDPLERRKLQLESVITTSKSTDTNILNSQNNNNKNGKNSRYNNRFQQKDQSIYTDQTSTNLNGNGKYPFKSNIVREITNFNDLILIENWLNVKIEQLNSSLLSSLGVSVPDSKSILSKHEQIALECRTMEVATLTFNGRNIHAIKSLEAKDDKIYADKSLFEQQKLLAIKVRDVITILDVRIVLLRRTIDFYNRSKEATSDIQKMMRRLQIDNSLQSVQFVANELEFKDVSSVVASGATIISELQQLQLAQQHGQRSRIVNLNLVTNGIRSIIDQLNQDLAHLKTVLNQRKLILLNEDANKMANNFSNKCHQLHFWLNNHVKSYLLNNNLLEVLDDIKMRQFCDNHEQLRVSVQNKTLEVEALLRSLTTLTEHFDPKSKVADEIQKATDDLRQDWINTTNCLDKRIEIARKYLAILNSVNNLSKELDSLDNFNKGKPTTTERTEDDIKSNVDQLFVQLTNQVKNFNVEAIKSNTELLYSQTLDGKQSISDINKQDLSDNSNRLLNQLVERKNSIIRELDSKRVEASKKSDPPAHQRPQQVDPPRFTRVFSDKDVEPFSTVELECETDDANCQVEWFMNNYKKIPASIKHIISRENNQHKLTISNFSPICCGTYIVRASNNAGQATIQCKLRLAGIKEAQNEQYQQSNSLIKQQTTNFLQQEQQHNSNNFQSSSPAISTTSSFSHWKPSSKNNQQQQQHNNNNRSTTTVTKTGKTITRIIEGVGSSERDSPKNQQSVRISQLTGDSDTDTNTNTSTTNLDRLTRETLPVTQVTYAGPNEKQQYGLSAVKSNNLLRVTNNNSYIVDSPISSTTIDSRSVSRSPFEGTPQPPVFVQGLTDSMSRCCSRAGLVCLVVGNPPPTIEWMHNNQKIATTKCPQTSSCPRASLCKLTIETVNNKTQGQYVCKASNRLGQTSTGITLKK